MALRVLFGLVLFLLIIPGIFASLQSSVQNSPSSSSVSMQSSPLTTEFPDYFRGPRLAKLYFTTYNDPTSEYSALQAGSIDSMDSSLPSNQPPSIRPNAAYQTNMSNDLGSTQAIFDVGRFPSNYTAFRQALSLMIDRGDIVTTALGGLGAKMPDQLTPSWPSAYHVPGGFNWDLNLAQANATLFTGGFRFNSTGNYWYNVANASNHVNPATTIFYSRSDDPHRLYIGVQVATMQGATKATYHFDRLFTVDPVTSYVTTRTVYNAPVSSGGGYNSNNCNGTGFPCFTAYTSTTEFATPDISWFWITFGSQPNTLDTPYDNFGHWVNSTINSLVNSWYLNPIRNDTQTQQINRMVTQQAWWDPLFYHQDWTTLSERITGHLTAQNSLVPGGSFAYGNEYSFWRAHLKGRTYGGSLRLGIHNPINSLNVFAPDSNWVYDQIVLQRIYDPLLSYDYDTGKLLPGLAYDVTVSTITTGSLPSGFDYTHWQPSSTAPYWTEFNGPRTNLGTGLRVDFNFYSNATWHDGSSITANDILWNIITDTMDPSNTLQIDFYNLADANITAPNTVSLWFNSTSWELANIAAGTPMAPPLPWLHAKGTWVGSDGRVSGISLSTKASLNLSAAGGLDMLDGSGSMKFDTATTGDPFAVGSTFDLLANNNWYHRDPAKANYSTGIADLKLYPGSSIISVSIALVNGDNAKGDVFSGGNFVTDPSTTSDTTSGATVTAIVYENPSLSIGLTYSSGTGLYTGSLPTTSLADGTYHIQITATKAGSIPTTYGPAGFSQASANGISWEGDDVNTRFQVNHGDPCWAFGTCLPINASAIALAGVVAALGATFIIRFRRGQMAKLRRIRSV